MLFLWLVSIIFYLFYLCSSLYTYWQGEEEGKSEYFVLVREWVLVLVQRATWRRIYWHEGTHPWLTIQSSEKDV